MTFSTDTFEYTIGSQFVPYFAHGDTTNLSDVEDIQVTAFEKDALANATETFQDRLVSTSWQFVETENYATCEITGDVSEVYDLILVCILRK